MNDTLDKDTFQQLVAANEMAVALLQQIINQADQGRLRLEDFREDLKQVRDQVSGLVKAVHQGNGTPPLIVRVSILEEQMEEMERTIQRLEQEQKICKDLKVAERKTRWEVVVAIISAVAVIAAGILSLFGK